MNPSASTASKTAKGKKAVAMPEQPPGERLRNFSEVALGYTPKQAMAEARRCQGCTRGKFQCVPNCPLGINIPQFIAQVAHGDFRGAHETIEKDNFRPGTCGRVCDAERRCQLKCTAGGKGDPICVGNLERFVGDWYGAQEPHTSVPIPKDAPKVAVIGSGPAGLAAASDLVRLKYSVTVFEALHEAGGALAYRMPEFQLPKQILRREIENIRSAGVKFYFNAVIGRLFTIRDLMERQGFQAVCIAAGTGRPQMLDVPGRNLKGVYSAAEFLSRVHMMKAHLYPACPTPILPAHHVAVVGGGDVAMDCARTAVRMGAEEVTVLYRRSLQELPARQHTVELAQQEGIRFLFLTTPVRLLGDAGGSLQRVECQEMELGMPDASGRPWPVPKKGSEFQLNVDILVAALGGRADPFLSETTDGLEVDRHGFIRSDGQAHTTSIPGVFTAGSIAGSRGITSAMGEGRAAARSIDEYLRNRAKKRTH